MHDADADLLARLPPAGCGYWVAYSGGRDSHVLLHRLARLRGRLVAPLGAVHVNHHLQPEAERWAAHCREQCAALDIPLDVLDVAVDTAAGDGVEAAARKARLAAWSQWLPAGGVLLTAHHREDQAETLLLQLLRGAGPAGLAAMSPVSGFAAGLMARPLLDEPREALAAYAVREELRWIDDPSNDDPRFDRNFLRHHVIPLMRQRWPSLSRTLARAARRQAAGRRLADETGAGDHARALDPQTGALSVPALQALSPDRQSNLLRYWIVRAGFRLPSERVLSHIIDDVLQAAVDAEPRVAWGGAEVRRHRDRLFLMPALAPVVRAQALRWRIADGPLWLDAANGVLSAEPAPGRGIAARFVDTPFALRFREGGECIRPAGRSHHRALKALLQERGVPGWERERIPLLYLGDDLVAVPGVVVGADVAAARDEDGWWPDWSRLTNL